MDLHVKITKSEWEKLDYADMWVYTLNHMMDEDGAFADEPKETDEESE